jgi:hypothetical protein
MGDLSRSGQSTVDWRRSAALLALQADSQRTGLVARLVLFDDKLTVALNRHRERSVGVTQSV